MEHYRNRSSGHHICTVNGGGWEMGIGMREVKFWNIALFVRK